MSNLGNITSVPQAQSALLPSAEQKADEITQKLNLSGQDENFARLGAAAASKTLGGEVSDPFSGSAPSSSQLASVARSNIPNQNNQNNTIITIKTYSQQDRQIIKFLANPVISDSRDAMYDSISVSHHPGEMLKYRTTNSRTWALNGVKLVSRTAAEATENLKKLNMIRSWVMPYYGQGTAEKFDLMFGAPPPVLVFSAYGASNIDEHPVVLLNYNFTYPNDVDYIECEADTGYGIQLGTPFPVLCDISLNLKESFSPAQFSGFDLSEYRKGKLTSAYIPPTPAAKPIKTDSLQSSPTNTPVRPLADARFEAASANSVEETNKTAPLVKLGKSNVAESMAEIQTKIPKVESGGGQFGGGASSSW